MKIKLSFRYIFSKKFRNLVKAIRKNVEMTKMREEFKLPNIKYSEYLSNMESYDSSYFEG